jgi:hypothetical protein
VLPSLEELLGFCQQFLPKEEEESDRVARDRISAKGWTDPLLTSIGDIAVGFEEGADVQSLSPP